MPMKKCKPEQIVALLRQIEVEIANGGDDSTSLQGNPDYRADLLRLAYGGCVIGIRKTVALDFILPGMKASVVFFDGNAQNRSFSNRLAMLNGDLVRLCPRSNQIIRQCNADLPIGPPSSDLPAG
jgi:hypothetical protein